MNKQLIVDAGKCTGCGLCQIACAINKTGQCEPSLARIKIWREETAGAVCTHDLPAVCGSALRQGLFNECDKQRPDFRSNRPPPGRLYRMPGLPDSLSF